MRTIGLAMALVAAGMWQAHAGEIADRAGKAESLLSTGDAPGALAAFEAASELFWTAMPLTVRTAVVADSATGYGIYVARDNAVFSPGSSLLVYVEPVGYGYGKDALGNVAMGFDVDLRLLGGDGKEVAAVDDIASVDLSSRARNREMFFKLTLNLDASVVPPGTYHAVFTLRDRYSDKRTSFPVDFQVAG